MIEKALVGRVNVEFVDTPLADTVDLIRRQVPGIKILIDKRALTDASISIDTPVTLSLSEATLATVLTHLSDELTFSIADDVLLITTREVGRSKMYTLTYDVRDLLEAFKSAPVDDKNTPRRTTAKDVNGP